MGIKPKASSTFQPQLKWSRHQFSPSLLHRLSYLQRQQQKNTSPCTIASTACVQRICFPERKANLTYMNPWAVITAKICALKTASAQHTSGVRSIAIANWNVPRSTTCRVIQTPKSMKRRVLSSFNQFKRSTFCTQHDSTIVNERDQLFGYHLGFHQNVHH